jgi:hypothetical protein
MSSIVACILAPRLNISDWRTLSLAVLVILRVLSTNNTDLFSFFSGPSCSRARIHMVAWGTKRYRVPVDLQEDSGYFGHRCHLARACFEARSECPLISTLDSAPPPDLKHEIMLLQNQTGRVCWLCPNLTNHKTGNGREN